VAGPWWLDRGQRLAWRHAEWWSLALSILAWALLIADGNLLSGHQWGSHPGHAAAQTTPMAASMAVAWLQAIGHWLLMTIAMMVPLVVDPIRTTAARSLWRRRHRAIAAFLAGYLLPWGFAGLFVAAFVVSVRPDEWHHLPVAVASAFAIAAAWQVAPARRRALLSCHRTAPIAPDGWRATRDCVTYGWTIGTSCLASCAPLMLVCIVSGHSVAAMSIVTMIGIAERTTPIASQSRTSAALAGLAVIILAFSLF
jgi:hypothetical protein